MFGYIGCSCVELIQVTQTLNGKKRQTRLMGWQTVVSSVAPRNREYDWLSKTSQTRVAYLVGHGESCFSLRRRTRFQERSIQSRKQLVASKANPEEQVYSCKYHHIPIR